MFRRRPRFGQITTVARRAPSPVRGKFAFAQFRVIRPRAARERLVGAIFVRVCARGVGAVLGHTEHQFCTQRTIA
eukprot:4537897-Lingulodinium_polyedra.AAC.1